MEAALNLEGTWVQGMKNRMGRVLAVLILFLSLGPSAQAASYTLAELVAAPADFTFDSADGTLSFGNFGVLITGVLPADLFQYHVDTNGDIISNGIQIIGPIGVAGGNAGDIRLQYDVFSNAGAIVGAELFFNGRAIGSGALANISEEFFTLPGSVLQPGGLTVFATGGDGGLSQLVDEIVFDQPVTALRVAKDIQVISDDGIFASISIIDQRFVVVPEPSTAALLGLGFVGMTLVRRRLRAGPGAGPLNPAAMRVGVARSLHVGCRDEFRSDSTTRGKEWPRCPPGSDKVRPSQRPADSERERFPQVRSVSEAIQSC